MDLLGWLWNFLLVDPMTNVLVGLARVFGGNFGIAIIVFTILMKFVTWPLTSSQYKQSRAMQELQPRMQELQKKYKGKDPKKLQQETMALYQREKINPLAGCLPLLLQIPVFYAVYKMLTVTIEMRHAPFFGWIHDLSAPDPTSIFNLFGLLPFDPPHFLMIGIWPLIMGATMLLQQKLNPQPADPVQAKIMMFLPLMFIFLFATFPAGLVIYWTWNNVLSVGQQWVIMRRMGVSA